MTAPSYTTDLATVNLCEAVGTWAEIPSRKSGGAATLEDRAYIQGSYCISQSTGAATGATVGLQFDYGGNISGWVSGWVFLVWQFWQAPFAIDIWANGGMRFGVGSSNSDVNLWNAQGNDYGRNPYGGYANVAIDPEFSYDEQVGTPTAGNYRYFWSAPKLLLAVSKGNPHCVDAIRYGRGELIIEYGEAANYGTFAGLVAKNDNNEATYGYNRWGLFQAEGAGYLWKGLMSFGNVSNACDFRDSNVNITIEDTPRTYAGFNKIEINNGGSRVDWTGVNMLALNASGLSIGSFEMKADATVNFTTCVFTDMSTFVFDSNATLIGVNFRRCGQVTQAGADIDDCVFEESTAAVALLVDNLNNIDNCDFTSDGTGHAMQLTSAHAGNSYTLTGCTYTGYASSDGSTGNECIYNNSGGAVTITMDGGDTPTIMNGSGASTTIVSGAVSVTVTAKTATGVNVENARVILRASNGTGPFPYQDSVTIVNSGTTATVTHTAHGMATSDKVQIAGASLDANNGVFTITVTGVDAYTYTMGSTPGSSPTGTIKSTFVALSGLTNASGVLTTARVYSSDQPVSGHARKSTSSPLYKSAPLVGDVDNVDGFSATAVMILDE